MTKNKYFKVISTMAKGRRLGDVGVTITFLFREDLLNALLSRGVDSHTAIRAAAHAAKGAGVMADVAGFLTNEEIQEIQIGMYKVD